ncbi:hypothetical protein T310_2165 [Rasamsonia emersonii CBS 393.64]|uniref:Uncharacterized protein n=1 Tax=Rasamsonia emersonii (strain ATCC 16479 / CBS 393.64 / IMI 116815) TaxID=1408163 RepID=A0A0F4YZY8_RASE3|nr:hypothetical protein T310_2165 [Rasamsonia emersonii CBS 393.64]KKA23814.1 hypothetical protein T310_2165 [Rasamsonia emersonii CBS 393.64]
MPSAQESPTSTKSPGKRPLVRNLPHHQRSRSCAMKQQRKNYYERDDWIDLTIAFPLAQLPFSGTFSGKCSQEYVTYGLEPAESLLGAEAERATEPSGRLPHRSRVGQEVSSRHGIDLLLFLGDGGDASRGQGRGGESEAGGVWQHESAGCRCEHLPVDFARQHDDDGVCCG